DDMGLGKTVQALALLLRRAPDGPALVVAPTSLGFNWAREAQQFAPGLTLALVRSGSELAQLGPLGPGDVVVTSYGLAARHAERLGETAWATLVLDESQSVKNAATQRAKALHGIEARFTLALTGTPVENRAEELWSLFRLVAPGLLGSAASFREELATPIQRGDEVARGALAALVGPFVLRRLKRDVARELPARTEVEHEVVLGRRARERYEEIRRATLRVLDGEDPSTPAQQRRFKALQALTRLRQLACHPGLLDPAWGHGSRKLDALAELLERLRDEGHKALVFSQFTSFLAKARARVAELGLTACYLDGSTPPKARQAEVDRFQAGGADVFLLSLKAGGTGLNLTAATYVIHLDPWWNPAVEDQATDRAHRIGQDQPVTVYRLIAKDTVEEGIVRLHAEKRELADALLAGAGSSEALGYEEMVALIAGGGAVASEDEDDEPEDDDGAEVAPAEPAPVSAPPEPPARRRRAAAPRATDADDPALARLASRLDDAVAAGTLGASAAKSYLRVMRRVLAFAVERALDATSEDALDAYVTAVESGALAAPKSDPAFARGAFKWLRGPDHHEH
ncbi:MAG: DEAD/DEAH box helicase, partial [Myxococcales bacterium]|nr:DEAD/DEAH box helicase [Myxococcales bacterium]